jgi:hypothetical protein
LAPFNIQAYIPDQTKWFNKLIVSSGKFAKQIFSYISACPWDNTKYMNLYPKLGKSRGSTACAVVNPQLVDNWKWVSSPWQMIIGQYRACF